MSTGLTTPESNMQSFQAMIAMLKARLHGLDTDEQAEALRLIEPEFSSLRGANCPQDPDWIIKGINRILRQAPICRTQEQLSAVCLEVVKEVTQSPFGFIGVFNPQTGLLDNIYLSGIDGPGKNVEGQPHHTPVDFSRDDLFTQSLRKGKAVCYNMLPGHNAGGKEAFETHPGIESFLGVPLLLNDRPFGLFGSANRPGGYDAQTQAAAEALAPAIVQTLVNLQAEETARSALESGINERNRLLAVMEALPIGLSIYDDNGGVIQANPSFEAVWGSPRPPANSVDDYDAYKAWWVDSGRRVQPEEWAAARAVRNGETITGQFIQIQRFDGTHGYVLNSGAPVRDASGQINGCAVAIMDITGLVQAETALRESQERFRVALSSVPLMVFTCDRDLRYTWVYNSLPGVQAEDLLGKRDDELTPVEAAAPVIEAKQTSLTTGQALTREVFIPQHGGRTGCYILRTEPVRDAQGGITGLICAAIDITEQKRLELEQREHLVKMEIQRRLMENREKERQQIALEIHDGPIQTLVSTIFNLQFTKETLKDPAAQLELDQIALSLKGAVSELREMMNELRPPSLIRFGLVRAIQMHAEDFRERHPDFTLSLLLESDEDRLDEQTRLVLFRIYQEALTNVVRHSRASEALISLSFENEHAVIEVKDNGVGFETTGDMTGLTRGGHFGLAGMKERTEAIGGNFQVTSVPGQGTNVRVTVPS